VSTRKVRLCDEVERSVGEVDASRKVGRSNTGRTELPEVCARYQPPKTRRKTRARSRPVASSNVPVGDE
jgi:hypothetical protein